MMIIYSFYYFQFQLYMVIRVLLVATFIRIVYLLIDIGDMNVRNHQLLFVRSVNFVQNIKGI